MTHEALTVEKMKHKLIPFETAREVVASTEPLNSFGFPAGEKSVQFKINPGWNHSLETVAPTELVDAYVTVGNGPNAQEFQLTKDGLLEATSLTGLPKGYVSRSPAHLTESELNYWFRDGLVGKDFKLLTANGVGAAFTRATIQPFSNLRILDETLAAIEKRFGKGELLVDYKFQHSLRGTHMRIIIPEYRRDMTGTGTDDDTWSVGIQLRNSLTGELQTELSGYLFRWVCTNGAIDTHATSGVWSRRGAGQSEDDVYAWARKAVDEVLGGLEPSLDNIQALVDVPIAGEASLVLRDVFEQYKIPTNLRNSITENMVDEDQMNMYSLMQAVTRAANEADMNPGHVERLMWVGGDLAHAATDRCDQCRRLMPH